MLRPMDYVKYSEQSEAPPADETEVIEKLKKMQMLFMKRDVSKRGQHPKSHGLVKIRFEVMADIPEPLKAGIFAQVGEYKGLIRFSNGGGMNDQEKDAHGMALKLLGVSGEKIQGNHASQDFILADCDVFFSPDVKTLLEFMQAQLKAKGGPPVEWMQTYPEAAKTLERFIAPPPPGLLYISYHGQTPYRLGDAVVKYEARPAAANGTGPETKFEGENFLREEMNDFLNKRGKEARFEFGVHVQTSAETEPVENPSKVWNTPFIKLAEFVIAPQDFDTDELNEFAEHLSFSPWHALKVHAPLGGINRARRIVYDASSEKRHAKTGGASTEPSADDVPGNWP